MLDGMRGVAALAVVVGHATGDFRGTIANPSMRLAVPFFFMLSGFVLTHAYQGRLRTKCDLTAFGQHRLIRLLPCLFLGGLLASPILTMRFYQGQLGDASWAQVLTAQVLSVTSLPTPFLAIDNYRWPVNHPAWSLFFEFIASAVLALSLVKLRTGIIGVVSLACFAATIVFLRHAHLLSIGMTASATLTGFAFPMGVLIYRLRRQRPKVGGSWMLPVIVITAIMFSPLPVPWFFQSLLLGLVLPALLVWAAGIPVQGWPGQAARTFGDLSYPLYILHWPIALWCDRVFPDLGLLPFTVTVCVVSIAVSFGVLKGFDEPVRRWLRRLADRRQALRDGVR